MQSTGNKISRYLGYQCLVSQLSKETKICPHEQQEIRATLNKQHICIVLHKYFHQSHEPKGSNGLMIHQK